MGIFQSLQVSHLFNGKWSLGAISMKVDTCHWLATGVCFWGISEPNLASVSQKIWDPEKQFAFLPGVWPSRPSHPFLAHFVVLQPIRLTWPFDTQTIFFWGNGPRTHLMVQLLKSHNSPVGCVWTWGMPKYTNRIAIVKGRKWWSTNGFS